MTAAPSRLAGITFAKQFPNAEEPFRGKFVAEQVEATRDAVRWAVVAPVPYVPRALARVLGKPRVPTRDERAGVEVFRPRYPVLPRRALYATVAPAMAAFSRGAFTRALEAVDAGFVHAHDLYPSGAAARRLARATGLPFVVTVHGSDLYTNLATPAWRAEIEATAAAASAVVCVSSHLARDVERELGVDSSRVRVIPNTYDAATFRFVDRRAHGGVTRLITVGRLVPEKGHEVLLHALAALDDSQAALTIVGDGPLRSHLTELAVALGIAKRVRFAGPLTGSALAAELAAADAFVLPSLREGFGVALVEAMATGLPAVATTCGGPSDIAQAGSCALVQPGDPASLAEAIRELLAGLQSVDRGAIAESVARAYSPVAVGSALVGLYESTVGQR